MSDCEATRILAIRHGETAWNVAARIQGHTDIALSEAGHRQARRLAGALADEALHAVYSSDLLRAFETALPIAESLGLQVRTDAGLRERAFGAFEGLTFDEVQRYWPQAALRWRRRDADFAAPGGETLLHFHARVVGAVERIAKRHRGQAIALVAHGGVLDCLYRAATRLELNAPRSWQLHNAAVNRLLHSGQGFAMVGWGDTQHLATAAAD